MATLYSMTGFGSAVAEGSGIRATVECRSVNGRGLTIRWRLGELVRFKESDFDAKLRGCVRRGSVTVHVGVERIAAVAAVHIDEAVVRAYQRDFDRLGLSPELIPTLPGVVKTTPEGLDDTQLKVVHEAFDDALGKLVAMREREGRGLLRHLGALLCNIEEGRASLEVRAPHLVEDYRERLERRLDALLGSRDTELDQSTLAREVAVMAARSDVTEELERIAGHGEQARELLATSEPVGRALEFLGQEFHREVNTMGAKASDFEFSRQVIALKAAVDRFREQVANVE